MKRITFALACTIACTIACTMLASSATAATPADDAVTRGAYLATAADCAACHTAQGGQPFAGGYPIASPMGTIWSTNITPSTTQGIGGWTEEQFAKAVREGVSPNGKLYPAMPYDSYAHITDADIKDLYAFFTHGVKAVDTPAKGKTSLSFPFNIRFAMTGWNALFLDKTPFAPRPGEDPQVARGRYLVDDVAHCSTCHTPRNFLMASNNKQYLAGAEVGGWFAPNLTPDPVGGIGGWSDGDILAYLKNGHAPGKGVAAGPMGEAVEASLRHLSDGDANAILRYLRTVPAQTRPGQVKPAYTYGTVAADHYDFDGPASRTSLHAAQQARAATPEVNAQRGNATGVTDGAVLYAAACATCHQPSGSGTKDDYYPSLAHSSAVGSVQANNLVMTILNGVDRHGADDHIAMPAFRNDMTDAQVAAVASFVAQHFGNPDMHVDAALVAGLREGSQVPALVRLMPWAMALAAVVILLLGTRLYRRTRRA